ncbi:HAD family hydrolase [Desulfovermiculus halophilus]|jgi:HAD superfamily hydrolase (TIGR01509 family)|uniref:HAD family hydrolase n=1 Tax=Desulfovermiculus halophilus TaxID=339722 RepID=UPI0004849E8D|nr:HAD family hydrolase [Desulfovermiculus halophilus]
MWQDVSWVRGVIFDCDGVLIDSREANLRFYSLILEKMGLPGMSAEDEIYVHMHTVQESLARIVPRDRLHEAMDAAAHISYREVMDWVRPQPGLIQFLTLLQTAGIRCAVNTNRTTTLPLILERFELVQFFHPVISASDVTWPKPHPESVYWVLQAWEMSPQDVAFIGDSQVDQYTAEAAGVRFWAYGNPGLEADRHVADYWGLHQNFCQDQPHCREALLS